MCKITYQLEVVFLLYHDLAENALVSDLLMSISSSIIRTSPAQSTIDASADDDLPFVSMQAKNRFFVGRVDLEDGIATLITYDHQSVELPLSLLPDQLVVGEVLSMKVHRDPSAEDKRMQRIFQLQNDIAEYLRERETSALDREEGGDGDAL